MTTEMFEGPDGLLYASPAECADAWAHEATRLRTKLAEAERDAERYRWIESHVSEQLTKQSLQHEYSEHKTQYVLPKLIAWANFCGQITFAEAIDAAMAREEG